MSDEHKKEKTCGTCFFSSEQQVDDINSVLTCRCYPPQVFAFPVPGKIAGSVSISVNSQFPTVAPDAWCGEWGLKMIEVE